ncbi:MAG: TerB family tellurite resistance protein [Burkholderiales bacterium]|nr:TerB family tellurite resistance protein [Burkholderiales bacterium]
MTEQENKAIITLALMAAFADGDNSDVERNELKRIASALSKDTEINVAAIYQDVILNRVSLDTAVAALTAPAAKSLAFELCVCVCDADGAQSEAERAFLANLRAKLALSPTASNVANVFAANSAALTAAPLSQSSPLEPTMLASTMSVAEQDKLILNYAILNGALELLPETLASMAIIPLQMKMVYRIGKTYGFELDKGHIKDFLATAGVGMASQYVEQIGVKLLGRVFGGGLIGGLIGGITKQTVSSGMSSATSYALGHLAKRYYAGGRTFSTAVLKDTYTQLLGEAQSMQGQYLPAIREKARSVNVAQILQEVRQ